MSSLDKSVQTLDLPEELLYIAVKPSDKGEYKLRYGGYKKLLLREQLSSRDRELLLCSVCEGVLVNASSNQIGDVVCECCASESSPLIPIRRVVSNLNAKCPQYFRGCKWSGVLSDILDHVNSCYFFYTSCPLSCDLTMLKLNIREHVANYCLERMVPCSHCSESVRVKSLTGHYDVCSMYTIECTNLCGLEIRRCQLEDHLSVDCPYRLVPCPYAKYGCDLDEIRFCDLEEHIDTKKDQHMSYLENFHQTQERNFELIYQTNIRRVENENEKLKAFLLPSLTPVNVDVGTCQYIFRLQYGVGTVVEIKNETLYLNLVRERNGRLYFVLQFPTPRDGLCITILTNQDKSNESIVFQPLKLDCRPLTPVAPPPKDQSSSSRQPTGPRSSDSQSRIVQTTFYINNQQEKTENEKYIQKYCFSVISSGMEESLLRFPFVKDGSALIRIGLLFK